MCVHTPLIHMYNVYTYVHIQFISCMYNTYSANIYIKNTYSESIENDTVFTKQKWTINIYLSIYKQINVCACVHTHTHTQYTHHLYIHTYNKIQTIHVYV